MTSLYRARLTVAVAVLAVMPCIALATTLQEELDLGKKVDAQITKQTPLSGDLEEVKEMDRVGQLIAKHVRRPEIPYTFRILDEGDELNAFSIPGGFVYFSERMWDTLSPDERAGVLAHEIAHIDGRHAIDAMSKAQRKSILTAVILIALNANQTWGDVAGLANNLSNLRYSRGDERDADTRAVQLSQEAQLNPAGILLAMRKIKRTQDEKGGQPPKILSTHPPTNERITYLESLLGQMSVPIPPENVKVKAGPTPVGRVIGVSKSEIQVTATSDIKVGDVIWPAAPGWDYRYENKTLVPVARAVVTSAGPGVAARYIPFSTAETDGVKRDMDVIMPAQPAKIDSLGAFERISGAGIGKLPANAQFTRFDRLLAHQPVWNRDKEKLEYEPVAYLVVTDPANPTGYAIANRAKYAYAPADDGGLLTRLADPDSLRWVGPVVSVGRGSRAVEVMPTRKLESEKSYELVRPAWKTDEPYSSRVVGVAAYRPEGSKQVLAIASWTPGWSIASVSNGFDIYEKAEEK